MTDDATDAQETATAPPGLEPDPESAEAVQPRPGQGTGGPGGPLRDMGGEIGPAGEAPGGDRVSSRGAE